MQLRQIPVLVAVLMLIAGCNRLSAPATGELPVSPLVGKPAPSLAGALAWLNGEETTLESLHGKVVLVHFFDYSCINSIRTFPYLEEWERRYAPLGLQVIGIHSPEFDFGLTPANVQANLERAGLTHPIAVDSYLKITGTYQNRYWPRLLLFDKDGIVRFDYAGEGRYVELERMLQALVRELNPQAKLPAVMKPVHDFDRPGVVCYPVTADLFIGRAHGAVSNHIVTFKLPAELEEGVIYAQGEWTVYDDYMRHAVDQDELTDYLALTYRASELNVVMKPESVYWMQVFVKQNGQPIARDVAGADVQYDADGRSFVKVDAARLYNLTQRQSPRRCEVQLSVRGKGLSVYGFSFGTSVIPTPKVN